MESFARRGIERAVAPESALSDPLAHGSSGQVVLSSPARIAVLIPCFNEAASIATVISGFQAALPGAALYVYDNNSTDQTATAAAAAGATGRKEPLQGKGNVVRRMFADIEAGIYVVGGGDSTDDP